MPTITFFPLGNADSYLITLANGQKILIDYANRRDPKDKNDLRIDLPVTLRENLDKQDFFDVVAFTHADQDHFQGATEFFYLEHAKKYQGEGRVHIRELWVPAKFILETGKDLDDEAKILRAEARHRFREGKGIRVFSQPEALDDWLTGEGLTRAERLYCISEAGTTVPGFTKGQQGVEFFVHSPFAFSQDDGTAVDRNDCSLVLQATFQCDDTETCFILSADVDHEILSDIVRITEHKGNNDRLRWDIFKLPHHCSYKSLSEEKGDKITKPVDAVRRLFEEYGKQDAKVIATCAPIPSEDSIQPPHRQAASYYRGLAKKLGDGFEFKVTMEHPSVNCPEPLVIQIDGSGAAIKKRNPSSAASIVSRPAPRAG
jgi:hypothetical protein